MNLHVAGRVYPLRDIMFYTNARLLPHAFMRVRRGTMVNAKRVAELIAYETGDGAARLGGALRCR
jgi:hypothetical protein